MLILYRFDLYKTVGAGGRRKNSGQYHIPGAGSASLASPRAPKPTGLNKNSSPASPGFFSLLTDTMGNLNYMSSTGISCQYLMNTGHFPPFIVLPSSETQYIENRQRHLITKLFSPMVFPFYYTLWLNMILIFSQFHFQYLMSHKLTSL